MADRSMAETTHHCFIFWSKDWQIVEWNIQRSMWTSWYHRACILVGRATWASAKGFILHWRKQFYPGLFVDENGILQEVNTSITIKDVKVTCRCCTHTLILRICTSIDWITTPLSCHGCGPHQQRERLLTFAFAQCGRPAPQSLTAPAPPSRTVACLRASILTI